jgi:uncharacterized protein YbjT (DUF2867 family)
MQLVASNEVPERPSVFDQALRIVRDILRQEPHAYFLWTNGRWSPASVDDIMRRANERLKNLGRPQFGNKREWIVA